MTALPDGSVIAGSASSPFIYRVRKRRRRQLADAASNTLWSCELTPTPGTTPVQRKSSLRGFDLATGKDKFRWTLPGDNSSCNDFSYGPDKAL